YPISPEAYRVIGLATRDEKGLSPVAKSFYNFVLYYMKAEGIYNV
ncbi:MAG: hypothetical protein PWP51_2475, partial [Clostridiales bacterium]|nr:hypothetical protein [Clostridiales bacterium]